MKIIKVTFNGKSKYLASTGYHEHCGSDKEKLVDQPMSAINYSLPPNDDKLERDLECFFITGVGGAKSGIRADLIEVVEFELQLKEVSSTVVLQGKPE